MKKTPSVFLFFLTVAFLLIGCSGGSGAGGGSGADDPGNHDSGGQPLSPASTAEIWASSETIDEGESVLISWETTNGTAALSPPIVYGAPAAGSIDVIPASTATYTVTCRAPDGRTASDSVTVNVVPAPVSSCAAPEISYFELLPERVLTPGSGLVTLAFRTAENADRIEIDLKNGEIIALVKVCETNWSVSVDTEKLLLNYVPEEPQVIVGYLDAYAGPDRISRRNLILPVRTAAMPDTDLRILDYNRQRSGRVLNIRYDGEIFLGGQSSTYDSVWRAVENTVKSELGERDIYVLIGQVEAFANRTGGGEVISFPNLFFFDLASRGTIHEIGHCLGLAYSGHPLLRDPAGSGHWAPGNAALGIMGWSLAGGAGATFPYRLEAGDDPDATGLWAAPIAMEFNDLELYKMGALPKEQVAPITQFTDPAVAALWLNNPRPLASCGEGCQRLDVPSRPVSIDEIIAADGETPPAAKTEITLGTVVLTRGRLLSPDEIAFIEYMAERGESGEPSIDVHEGLWSYAGKPFRAAARGLIAITASMD
ncbi:MAG: hypothetical protein V1867_02635 [Candidatus Falkowbacteria bacterium]